MATPAPQPPPYRFRELLDPAQLAAVLAAGTSHAHPVGTVLLREGQRSRSVLIMSSGVVKVVATGATGNQALLAIRGSGDVLGELSALDDLPHSATVVAAAPVELLRVPAADFVALLRRHPGIAYALLRVIGGRLRLANVRRIQHIELTTAQRVARVLAELAADHGVVNAHAVTIDLPFRQDDLAMMVGASREAVVRALRALRDDKVISTGRQRLTILQPEALHQLDILR